MSFTIYVHKVIHTVTLVATTRTDILYAENA